MKINYMFPFVIISLLACAAPCVAQTKTQEPIFAFDFGKTGIAINSNAPTRSNAKDISPNPEFIEAAYEVTKDNKLSFRFKATPEFENEVKLTPLIAMPYITLDAPPLPLDQPVVVEFCFRCAGKGAAEVDLRIKESYDKNGDRKDLACKYKPPASPSEALRTDWITERLKVPSAAMRDIGTWCIELTITPEANFTLEVDHLKVLPNNP